MQNATKREKIYGHINLKFGLFGLVWLVVCVTYLLLFQQEVYDVVCLFDVSKMTLTEF